MIQHSTSVQCRICGAGAGEWLYPQEMMLGTREQFTYFRCASCDCLQLAEVPEDLGKYYPANYYSFEPTQDLPIDLRDAFKRKFIYPPMTRHIAGWKSVAGHMLCHLVKHPCVPVWLRFLNRPISFSGPILDVGCGSGSNLLALRDCGFMNLHGLDPFISKSLFYRGGIQIRKSELEEIDDKFCLIMFHHVFEHLPDPVRTLKKSRKLLEPGGQILIRVPLSDSVAAEKYKEKWVQLDAPRHITIPTRKSMDLIAKKSGLKIVKVTYDSSDFQFWGSEQYLADIPLFRSCSEAPGAANIFSKEQIEFFAAEAERLNKEEKGDQAAFTLEEI